MTTGAQAIAAAVRRLRDAGVPDPHRDARLLLAHALSVAPDRVTLLLPETVDAMAATVFDQAVAVRAMRQPLSQIVGSREFWGRRFRVTPDVLDPRPETETLVAEALRLPAVRVLDLGTGSGCILLTLLAEWPDATGLGTDLSEAALNVARDNAAALGLSGRTAFLRSDWLEEVSGKFDLIVSNPPYITDQQMKTLSPEVQKWEPRQALTPGTDGLGAYRALLPDAASCLAPGGRVLVEFGVGQGQDVLAIGAQAGLGTGKLIADLDQRDRVACFDLP